MRNIAWLIFLFWFSGCESPMDNRVQESKNSQQKINTLKETTLVLNESAAPNADPVDNNPVHTTVALTVKATWLEGPIGSINVNNTLLVRVYDEQGAYTDLPENIFLQFYSTMPSMGHPMDDAGTFTRISTGFYLNETIKYNMPGDWQNELWLMNQDYQILAVVKWLEYF
jgi:hypothetical protein